MPLLWRLLLVECSVRPESVDRPNHIWATSPSKLFRQELVEIVHAIIKVSLFVIMMNSLHSQNRSWSNYPFFRKTDNQSPELHVFLCQFLNQCSAGMCGPMTWIPAKHLLVQPVLINQWREVARSSVHCVSFPLGYSLYLKYSLFDTL